MGLIDIYPQPDLGTSKIPEITAVTWRTSDLYLRSNWTWNEVIASTPVDYAAFGVITHKGGDNSARIMALAVGPAGSEVIVFVGPTRVRRDSVGSGLGYDVSIPVPIPAGSRVSVALMSSTAHEASLQVAFFPSPLPDLSGITRCDYGPINLTGDSVTWGNGYNLVFPATAHVKSAWQEISAPGAANKPNGAALADTYAMLGFVFNHDTINDVTAANDIVVDLAYGAAGVETPFIEGLYLGAVRDFAFSAPNILWVPWNRPPGDRVSVRLQHANTVQTSGIRLAMLGLR